MVNKNRQVHTLALNSKNNGLTNYWITGFADGEGSFMVSISKNSKSKLGWKIEPCFTIHLHGNEIELLSRIKSDFKGVGTIRINKKDLSVLYSVSSFKDLTNVIVPHHPSPFGQGIKLSFVYSKEGRFSFI